MFFPVLRQNVFIAVIAVIVASEGVRFGASLYEFMRQLFYSDFQYLIPPEPRTVLPVRGFLYCLFYSDLLVHVNENFLNAIKAAAIRAATEGVAAPSTSPASSFYARPRAAERCSTSSCATMCSYKKLSIMATSYILPPIELSSSYLPQNTMHPYITDAIMFAVRYCPWYVSICPIYNLPTMFFLRSYVEG